MLSLKDLYVLWSNDMSGSEDEERIFFKGLKGIFEEEELMNEEDWDDFESLEDDGFLEETLDED